MIIDKKRYNNAITEFKRLYGMENFLIISAPGRTEICGNHTDHQRGNVVCAAVDLDIILIAAPTDGQVIRLKSEGFSENVVDLNCPPTDISSNALIFGITEWFKQNGYTCGGFSAYTTSQVLKGSGLSSSAAFEIAVGQAINLMFNEGKVTLLELAKAGQYAENHYFQKPSGLMDQTASAYGGLVGIDFADLDNPVIQTVELDLQKHGYGLCIVDTKGDHADLTGDYAAIPTEMKSVASYFGKDQLRDVLVSEFYDNFAQVRAKVGDRAVLRAMHFFNECERAKAVVNSDFDGFLELIQQSGNSSWQLLQNIHTDTNPAQQEMAIALALTAQILGKEKCAYRVHGGGFAGTIQVFLPLSQWENYRAKMSAVFGEDACYLLNIRQEGVVEVDASLL